MMATPTFQMLWLTMLLAALAVLVAGDGINSTSTASPKVPMSTTIASKIISTTTEVPAPFTPVMDIFQAPLAAFKPEMKENIDMPMGRDDTNTPAPTNIFFRAGNGLGSAASSLTGWFNNRMIPQALRPASSTTPAPQIISIIPNQQIRRRVMAASGNRRKPQRPVVMYDAEDEEDDEDEPNNEDDSENSENENNQDIMEDDEDDDYEPVQKRKDYKQTQKRPNMQYFYIEEQLPENDDYNEDFQKPIRKNQRKQQQNLTNRRRKNPPKKNQQKQKKPVRRVQNSQLMQVVQNRPSNTQVKRKRRPSATFELVPISQNQAMNSIQKKKPQNANQQRPVSQFLSIPWTRLGLAGPPKDPSSNEQQSPIIVRFPQQNNIKRKKRPVKKPVKVVKNRKRKPVRGQLQDQSPVFSLLNEDQIREIFKNQLNEPSKTKPQISNLPVVLDTKKKQPVKESEEVPSNNNNDNEPQEKPPQAESQVENKEENANNSFIVVGAADDDDDKEIDLNLYRHYDRQRGFRLSHNWEDDEDEEYDE